MQKKNKRIGLLAILAIVAVFSPEILLGATAPTLPEEITVENCVKRMGFTEEKCQEIVDKFNNMTDEEKAAMKSRRPENMQGRPDNMPPRGNSMDGKKPEGDGNKLGNDEIAEGNGGVENQIRKTQQMREQKANQFSKIEKRVEKMIEFLQSKDVDTTEIEANLNTFKEKAETILSAIDTYIESLQNKETDTATTVNNSKEEREKVKTLTKELIGFYRDTLRKNIEEALNKLED